MPKWVKVFIALFVLATFSIGCAGITNERRVKCPKCSPDVEMKDIT